MRWPSSVCIAFLIVPYARVMASPGSTSAHCMQNTTWMDNALGQIPCLVVGKLIADPSCLNEARDILPLTGAGQFYPNLGKPGDACMCSGPLYSLFAACALCQRSDAGFESWGDWTKNCTRVYSTYQGNIPNDTQIPSWAQLDVESRGTFDVAAASSAAVAAASTSSSSSAPTSSSSTISTSTSTFPPISNSTTPTPFAATSNTSTSASSTATASGTSHNAGAIAGGVVGGLAFVALLLGIGFWVYHRRSRPSSTTLGVSTTMGSSNSPQTYQRSEAPLRYYDPSNPSTYPDALTPRPEDVQSGYSGAPMSVQYGAGSNAR